MANKNVTEQAAPSKAETLVKIGEYARQKLAAAAQTDDLEKLTALLSHALDLLKHDPLNTEERTLAFEVAHRALNATLPIPSQIELVEPFNARFEVKREAKRLLLKAREALKGTPEARPGKERQKATLVAIRAMDERIDIARRGVAVTPQALAQSVATALHHYDAESFPFYSEIWKDAEPIAEKLIATWGVRGYTRTINELLSVWGLQIQEPKALTKDENHPVSKLLIQAKKLKPST